MPSRITKITVLHPDLRIHGGAERYAHSVIRTLHQLGYNVDIWDIHRALGPVLRMGLKLFPRFTLLKYALVCAAWRISGACGDAIVHTFACGPSAGHTSISVLHTPDIFSTKRQNLIYNMLRPNWVRCKYITICRWLAAPKPAMVYITNSPWTYARLSPAVRRQTYVIPPPIPPITPKTSPPKSKSLLTISRFTPSKRIDRAIAACDRVIPHHPELTLTLFGAPQGATYRRLKRAAGTRPWLRLRSGDDHVKNHLLETSQFGLHTAENEHFGISICEMIAAGRIPLVHRSGSGPDFGVPEQFLFAGTEELAARISAALDINDQEYEATVQDLQSNALFCAAQQHNTQLTAFFKTHLPAPSQC